MIKEYLNNLADKVSAMASLGGTTPHRPDIGLNREELLRDVLNRHLPKCLDAMLGGVTLALDGTQSNQIDIIVRADNAPRFEEQSRSFVPVESLVAAISVKSTLNKGGLENAISNLASVPQFNTRAFRFVTLKSDASNAFLSRHPTMHIYAFGGYSTATACLDAITTYLAAHPEIPENRYPREIVVHGKYFITYNKFEMKTKDGTVVPAGSFWPCTLDEEHRGLPLARLINHMFTYVSWMPYLNIEFDKYINTAFGFPDVV